MIDYMVKYQNNFVSSFIFLRNFHLLLEKDIPVRKLLDSHIFNYTFDFDEWPGNHPFAGPNGEDHYVIKPYSGSIFRIRKKYTEVFSEPGYDRNSSIEDPTQRVYKIKYSMNLLPQLGQYLCPGDDGAHFDKIHNQNVLMMGLCEAKTGEIGIYETDSLK